MKFVTSCDYDLCHLSCDICHDFVMLCDSYDITLNPNLSYEIKAKNKSKSK